jgi:hypothetical protein
MPARKKPREVLRRQNAPISRPALFEGISSGRAQWGALTGLACIEYLISLALESARRILGSSEPSSNVISLLQCWQFT